jgi:LmbE family N-acetylglucosaminyl deacetylase
MTAMKNRAPAVIGIALILACLLSWVAPLPTQAMVLRRLFKNETAQSKTPLADLPGLGSDDRVLILAPHPDDEIIACSGLIRRALKAKARVKVVFLTNGDHNEPSYLVYKKRLALFRGEFIGMGRTREKESLAALQYLGLNAADAVFLGYPDYGTMDMMFGHWDVGRPFRDKLTRISEVPYNESPSFGSTYIGQNILRDLRREILGFRPTKVFVSHPCDANRDHRALYLFTRITLWDCVAQLKTPLVFPYLIHVVGWPAPRGIHPDLTWDPPQKMAAGPAHWYRLRLFSDEKNAKKTAVSFAKSQLAGYPAYLFTFVRANELFSDYPAISLKNPAAKRLLWRPSGADRGKEPALVYGRKGNVLLIKLTPQKSRYFKGYIRLLPYRHTRDFSLMPKLTLFVAGDKLVVYRNNTRLRNVSCRTIRRGRTSLVFVSLKFLGDPDRLLVCLSSKNKDFSLDDLAWRILELK